MEITGCIKWKKQCCTYSLFWPSLTDNILMIIGKYCAAFFLSILYLFVGQSYLQYTVLFISTQGVFSTPLEKKMPQRKLWHDFVKVFTQLRHPKKLKEIYPIRWCISDTSVSVPFVVGFLKVLYKKKKKKRWNKTVRTNCNEL